MSSSLRPSLVIASFAAATGLFCWLVGWDPGSEPEGVPTAGQHGLDASAPDSSVLRGGESQVGPQVPAPNSEFSGRHPVESLPGGSPQRESGAGAWGPVIGILATHHGCEETEVVQAIVDTYGEGELENVRRMAGLAISSEAQAVADAAKRISDHYLGHEEDQSANFYREVLGMGLSEYISEHYEPAPEGDELDLVKAQLHQEFWPLESMYALYCNEMRSAVYEQVYNGNVEIQPLILIPGLAKPSQRGQRKGVIARFASFTDGNWAFDFELTEGDAPVATAARADWLDALAGKQAELLGE